MNSDSDFEFFVWQVANNEVVDFIAYFQCKAANLRSMSAIVVQRTAYFRVRVVLTFELLCSSEKKCYFSIFSDTENLHKCEFLNSY